MSNGIEHQGCCPCPAILPCQGHQPPPLCSYTSNGIERQGLHSSALPWQMVPRPTTHPQSHHPHLLKHYQCSCCIFTTTPQSPLRFDMAHQPPSPPYIPVLSTAANVADTCPSNPTFSTTVNAVTPPQPVDAADITTTSILLMPLM